MACYCSVFVQRWTNGIIHVMNNLFFFKQKTAYEMRISDWSSDVCSSDLRFHKLTNAVGVFLVRAADHHGVDAHGKSFVFAETCKSAVHGRDVEHLTQ